MRSWRGSVLLAIDAGRCPHFSREDIAQVASVPESRFRGHDIEGEVALREQLFRPLKLHAGDLGLGRSADESVKSPLQHARRWTAIVCMVVCVHVLLLEPFPARY